MSLTKLIPSRDQGVVANVIQGIIIGILLTALSYGVGLEFGWITELNMLEVFAVFTSYACTFLCVMERRFNYVLGAISTAAYCVLFYQFGLFASMAINGFLAVYLVYGWFRWRSDKNTRPVTNMTMKQWILYGLVAAASYVVIVFLASAAGGSLVWTDSVIFTAMVLAQFMLDNKKIETWGVWAVVNVFAIYTYATAGLALVAFQYIFFLLNTVYGYIMWRKNRQVVLEPAQSAVLEPA